MNKIKTFFCLILCTACLCGVTAAQARGDFQHLKNWAGKYATDGAGKSKREILRLPEVRSEMTKILGARKYAALLETYDQELPIDLLGNYLVVGERQKWSEDKFEHFLYVVIDTAAGSNKIYVGYFDGDEQQWFSNDATNKKPPLACEICNLLAR